jgi:hypothetical protein
MIRRVFAGVILFSVLSSQALSEASFTISIDKPDIVIGEVATISLEWSKLDSCRFHIFAITVYPPNTVKLPAIRSPDWLWNSTEQPFKVKVQYLADKVGTYVIVGNAFHNGRVPPEDVRSELRVRNVSSVPTPTTTTTSTSQRSSTTGTMTDVGGVRFSNLSLLLCAALALGIVVAVAAIARRHRYSHNR